MPYLTSTSTTFLLLQNDVSHLWDAFNWTVGGIGISVTIVTFLLAWYQNRQIKMLAESEINKLKNELRKEQDEITSKINEKIDLKLNEIQVQFKNDVDTTIFDIKKDIKTTEVELKSTIEKIKKDLGVAANEAGGEIARSFAISNQKNGALAHSFIWWLNAISKYITSNYDRSVVDSCISEAISDLKNIDLSKDLHKNYFVERLNQSEAYFKKIENRYPGQTKIMRQLVEEKIKLI